MKRTLKILLSLPFLLALGALGLYALGGFVAAPWWIKRELPQLMEKHLSAKGAVGEIAINPFKLTVEARDFSMTESGGSTPAIAFDRLFVDFEATSLFRRAWTFAEITLERPRFNLETDAKGALNLARLAPQNPQPKKDPPKSALPRLLMQKLMLKQGVAVFTDKAVSRPAVAKLEPVDFELRDLSTLPDQRGEYTLSARFPAGGTFGWRGVVTLAPIASAGQIEIKAVKLATLWQFVQDKVLIEAPGGSATLALKYDARYADSQLAASASDLTLRVSDIAVQQRGAPQPALTAGEVALTGGAFDLAQRKVQFAELALGKIAAHTLLDAEGKANWAQLVAPSKPAPAPPQAQPAAGAPWQVGIDAVNVADVRLTIVDQGFVQPLAIDVARTSLRAGVKASVGAQTTASIDNIAVQIEDIRVAAVDAKEPLVSLAAAELAGGAFDLAQNKFSVESIKLSKPVTAVTRDAKGAINLATAFARKIVKPPEPSTLVAEIAALELTDGSVAFRDQGKDTPLALDFQNIRVAANNISNRGKGVVPFEAGLQIKQGGTLRAQGSATPAEQRASFKLEARNLALLPLAALLENKVLLEQFTLGERVESPTAINLPLDLAIALLTDSSGRIDLSVPVRGNVDAPEFAYGHLIWQAIRTVITNIVTAPFRALASLFGGSSDKLDAIGFEAGRAQLAPPEREKLTRVAGVLKQRPQLRLVVEGRYDVTHDGAALRAAAARRTLAERQGLKLAAADDPLLVNYDNARTQRTIEALLEERAGADSIGKFKASHEKSTGKEVSRVNPALALIGRGSPDRQFYEAMFKQVIVLQPLDKEALPALAAQRSGAIADYLKTAAGLEAQRVNVKSAAEVKADKATEITTALNLDAGK